MRAMSARDDDLKTARQLARSKQRKAGDRSTRLAHAIMKLAPAAAKKLELEEDLRDAVDRARAVTSLIARRRAERTLAGDLRRFDLIELAGKLARLHEAGNIDAQELHLAEHWRARLIAEGMAVAPEFPGVVDDALPRLIDAATRERDTGRPPGAARALFRHLVEALRAERPAADASEPPDEAGDEADDDDQPDDDAAEPRIKS